MVNVSGGSIRISVLSGLLMILFMAFLFSAGASEADMEYTLQYEIDGTEASVVGFTGSPTIVTIPDTYTIDGIDYPVATIGFQAFAGSDIEELVLGENVTYIAPSAFINCTSLKSITFPSYVKNGGNVLSIANLAFSNTGFKEVVLYKNLDLALNVFHGCGKLTTITLPEGNHIAEIPSKCFWECPKITGTIVLDNIYISDSAFWDSGTDDLFNIVIKDNVTLGDKAFAKSGIRSLTIDTTGDFPLTAEGVCDKCYHLKEIRFNGHVKNIPLEAFSNCTALINLYLDDNVGTIDVNAFKGCTNLIRVVIGSGLSDIGSNAFKDCDNLVGIFVSSGNTYLDIDEIIEVPNRYGNIGDTVQSISHVDVLPSYEDVMSNSLSETIITRQRSDTDPGYYFFYRDVNNIMHLALYDGEVIDGKLTLPAKVDGVDGGYHISNNAFANRNDIRVVDMSEADITAIDDGAFYGCTELKKVILPYNVSSLGESCFYGCVSLESIYIPATVADIPFRCFYGCSSLKEVRIDNGIRSIEDQAFGSCESLREFTVPDSVRVLGDECFSGCYSLRYVTIGTGLTTLRTYGLNYTQFADCNRLEKVFDHSTLQTMSKYDVICNLCAPLDSEVTAFGITYRYSSDIDDNTAIIADVDPSRIGNVLSLGSITVGDRTLQVRSVPDRAFANCTGIRSLITSPNIIYYGSGAFDGCTSLKVVYISDLAYIEDATTFRNCKFDYVSVYTSDDGIRTDSPSVGLFPMVDMYDSIFYDEDGYLHIDRDTLDDVHSGFGVFLYIRGSAVYMDADSLSKVKDHVEFVSLTNDDVISEYGATRAYTMTLKDSEGTLSGCRLSIFYRTSENIDSLRLYKLVDGVPVKVDFRYTEKMTIEFYDDDVDNTVYLVKVEHAAKSYKFIIALVIAIVIVALAAVFAYIYIYTAQKRSLNSDES